MKILVQKFGGTSVVDEKARTAVKDKVQQAIRSGYAPRSGGIGHWPQGRALCY